MLQSFKVSSSHVLLPHAYPFCVGNMENIQHLLFDCGFASKCWFRLLQSFNICWAFDHDFKNVTQVLVGLALRTKTADLLWVNTVKALLVGIWFERNQKVFMINHQLGWNVLILPV